MNTCQVCGTTKNIVHSGVDALCLQVMDKIEKICYTCANKQNQERKEMLQKPIFEYNLTRDSLMNDFSYMNDDVITDFTDGEIEQLKTDLLDAVYGVIEDFMNHRKVG